MLRSFRPVFALLLALASVPSFAESEPADCKLPAGAGSLSCDQQQKCIDARFKAVLSKDPTKVCEQNNKALWDKALSAQLPQDSESNVNAVCSGTYVRLQNAVHDYKTVTYEACNQRDAAKSCVNSDNVGEGNAAMECAAKVARDNLTLSQRARAALQKARDEADTYKQMTQEVKKRYLHDIDALQDLEGDMADKGMSKAQISAAAARAATLTGDTFGDRNSNVTGPVDVNARNGGAGTLAEYEGKQAKLIQEQDSAAATIDAFNAASKREIEGRMAVETSLRSNVGKDLIAADRQSTVSSKVTGSDTSGGAKTKSSDDSSSDSGSLLKNATSLASLATAGAGLANAMNKNNSAGASSAPNSFNEPSAMGQASSPTPQALAPSGFGDTPGVSPAIVGQDSGGKGGRSSPVDHISTVDGGSGSVRPGFVSGSEAAPGAAGSPSFTGTYVPGGGMADATIKDDGRAPASAKDGKSCSSADCGAMGDLKTEQFNAGGSLGIPKIGAPDPALATKGALDALLGPLPALDSLIPKDTGAPGLQSVLSRMDQALLGGVPAGESHASASAQVAPANSQSLFDRVHSVHEVALKRGSVALYHKKL